MVIPISSPSICPNKELVYLWRRPWITHKKWIVAPVQTGLAYGPIVIGEVYQPTALLSPAVIQCPKFTIPYHLSLQPSSILANFRRYSTVPGFGSALVSIHYESQCYMSSIQSSENYMHQIRSFDNLILNYKGLFFFAYEELTWGFCKISSRIEKIIINLYGESLY